MKHKPQIVFTKTRNNLKRSDKLEGPWIIHKDGTKTPLWKNINGYWFREDRWYNLRKSEQTFWDLTRAYNRVFYEWQKAFDDVKKVGKACCYVSRKHGYNPPRWICYTVHDNGGYSTIGHDDVDMKDPLEYVGQQRVFNVAIGKRFLKVDVHLDRMRKWRMYAKDILEQAFKNCCPELKETKTNGITKLTVNERDYYFSRTITRKDYVEVKPIYFAGEGEFVEVVK